MSSWRDDLPTIPTERIRAEAIREGHRRREVRQRRQRAAWYTGVAVASVVLVVIAGSLLPRDTNGGGGGDASATTAAPRTVAAATTAAASATTAATSATTVAAATAAPATTAPSYTTVRGPIGALPPSGAVSITPLQIWEQRRIGAACGPSMLVVEFRPGDGELGSPVVHWQVAGVQDEAPMVIDGDVASATIGPFPTSTLDRGTSHEVLVYVTDVESVGAEILRSPTVILHDCSA